MTTLQQIVKHLAAHDRGRRACHGPAAGHNDVREQVACRRAERSGNNPDRTYTLSATATDQAGNAGSQVANCVVPHDKGK
jgi:hypothetical protein